MKKFIVLRKTRGNSLKWDAEVFDIEEVEE